MSDKHSVDKTELNKVVMYWVSELNVTRHSLIYPVEVGHAIMRSDQKKNKNTKMLQHIGSDS